VNNSHSDALVCFGATGDLAYKKIFPALQAMLKLGHLNVPVIGVAKAGWTLDQLRARAFDSLENMAEPIPRPSRSSLLCSAMLMGTTTILLRLRRLARN
jgi:glucose-6-phosphate 1-dehydrogenase